MSLRKEHSSALDLFFKRKGLYTEDGLTTVEASAAIAEQAARLRSQYSLRTPDAIQIATAQHTGASALLTNDIRWPALPDLHILTLDRLS